MLRFIRPELSSFTFFFIHCFVSDTGKVSYCVVQIKMFPDDCLYPMIPLEPIGEIKTLINVGIAFSLNLTLCRIVN